MRYVSLTRNFGHEACLRAGLRHADGRAVIVMDADFEHPPELIPDLVKQWRAGFKIVAAQRLDDEASTSMFKRMTSRLYAPAGTVSAPRTSFTPDRARSCKRPMRAGLLFGTITTRRFFANTVGSPARRPRFDR